jgi:hypothetical protein
MSDAMPARAILWPVLAQVALTFCVGLLVAATWALIGLDVAAGRG